MDGRSRVTFERQRTPVTINVPARLQAMVALRSTYWDIPEDDLLVLFALQGAAHQAALDGNEFLQKRLTADMEKIITIHGYAIEELLTPVFVTRG